MVKLAFEGRGKLKCHSQSLKTPLFWVKNSGVREQSSQCKNNRNSAGEAAVAFSHCPSRKPSRVVSVSSPDRVIRRDKGKENPRVDFYRGLRSFTVTLRMSWSIWTGSYAARFITYYSSSEMRPPQSGSDRHPLFT